jgi:flagellin-like protein
MRKLLKSRKALSPVVAAIILIAVTVAVSIAVAAWMGSLTIGFMETAELTITDVTFDGTSGSGTDNNIILSVTNSGTSDVTIATIKINSGSDVSDDVAESLSFDAGTSHDLTIDTTADAWESGKKYSVSLFATDGTLIGSFTDTA